MTTTASVPPLRRRGPRRGAAARRWITVLLAVTPALVGASCQADGAAVIAPYRSPPLPAVSARVVTGTAGVLALSPDGSLQAFASTRRGVCFQAVGAAAANPAVCADLRLAGSPAVSAAFSADGRWVAVGQDVSAQGRGLVWLVDPRTGGARPVPTADGRTAVTSSGAPAPSSPGSAPGPSSVPARPSIGTSTGTSTGAAAKGPAAAYTGMVWGAAGDLLLISSTFELDGPRSRLVDVDPISLVPRVVAQATGPYEFQSGYLATGGSTVLFTVYRGDQLLPNLVDIDLVTGARREVGPLGPAGTQLVPLAVSPDGRVAVVGSATLSHPGPPRLLDIASGRLVDVPGLSGDFGAAAFSPDGARVAVVSTDAGGRLLLALAALGAARLAPARTLGAVDGPLPRAVRLHWSGFDVLSLAGAASPGPASVSGWVLAG